MVKNFLERARAREGAEESGSLILDILIGMAIFALIAIIAVSAIGQYRVRAYEQGVASDATAVGLALEAAFIDSSTYPADTDATLTQALAADGALSEVTLTKGNRVVGYEVMPDGESFLVCVEHATDGTPNAYALYDSAAGGLVDRGQGEGCTPIAPPDDTDDTPVAEPAVVAWGWNNNDQATVPTDLDAADITQVSAGWYHNLALKADGTVTAWGGNYCGQSDVPAGLSDVVQVEAVGPYSLAVKVDGTVVGWGENCPNGGNSGAATIPAGLSDVVQVGGGAYHSLALKGDGTVVGWGSNQHGQLDIPAGLTDVTAIAVGHTINLALKSDGTVVAWGRNGFGEAADAVPAGLSDVTSIAAGDAHFLAVKSDGTVVAWGHNNAGQTDVPTGLTGVRTVSAGEVHSVALKTDGSLVVWGADWDGQTTVPAEAGQNVLMVDAGYAHNVAVVGP